MVLQDPGTSQEGVFLLSCALCHLSGTGARAGLCFHRIVYNYLLNRQKSNFSLKKSLVLRIKHNFLLEVCIFYYLIFIQGAFPLFTFTWIFKYLLFWLFLTCMKSSSLSLKTPGIRKSRNAKAIAGHGNSPTQIETSSLRVLGNDGKVQRSPWLTQPSAAITALLSVLSKTDESSSCCLLKSQSHLQAAPV
ncbi:hypothetical protein Nmel_009198 [Mimus melanotis]